MKTFIIATILSAGVLLRPEMAPGGNSRQFDNAVLTAAARTQTSPQLLDSTDLAGAVGGGVSCFGEIEQNGTSVYQTCCFSIWIIRICVSIYIGEIMAPVTHQ
jgi:hypothetical protein